MSFHVSPRAPYGSLLKQPAGDKKRKAKPAKSARERDEKHLAAVRRCPCVACDVDPAGVAAHVRMSAPGKPNAGIGSKPDDRDALPLCPTCHTDGKEAQHKIGEADFWNRLGLNPIAICWKLYEVSPDVAKMRAVIHAVKEGRK